MSENIRAEINQLENKSSELSKKLGSFSGQYELLEKQYHESKKNLKTLSHKKEVYSKAVELLILVQKITKEKIKEGFETIVTYALQYILNSSEYKLNLEFGRRGNLQEVDFNLITPNCKEAFDPLDSSGGGVLDVLSLALRISLMELTKPKIEGFLALDEPFKHLSENYIPNAGKFLKAINKRIGRQIIMVTHKEKLLEFAENRIIGLK